ncbi:MAG TPA: hypothetical protein DCY35_04110 [Prolixibacteraceae bacterium]|nr:hypothetical protein [Prolixibacteraceae bacterium]
MCYNGTQLFDLEQDQLETFDLAGNEQFTPVIHALREELLQYRDAWDDPEHHLGKEYWSKWTEYHSYSYIIEANPWKSGGSKHMETKRGNQRLEPGQIKQFESLGYGMFIHFGMSTFLGIECPGDGAPSNAYAPDRLDVGQWISVARDAGMKYAVLTAKHVSGHALWPTRYSDYSVATSGNTKDVVGEFVYECRRKGVMPGFYYCTWDTHNLFGSVVPPKVAWGQGYTTPEYREFMLHQLEELLTGYGEIGEVWIDIPYLLPRDFRHRLYDQISVWQPQALIVINCGVQDGSNFNVQNCWPTDVITLERFLPNDHKGYIPWKTIEGKEYYIPGETCTTIGEEWFWTDGDQPRKDALLLGNYLVARSRGCNFLLDVPPDNHGSIPQKWIDTLTRLNKNIEHISYTL